MIQLFHQVQETKLKMFESHIQSQFYGHPLRILKSKILPPNTSQCERLKFPELGQLLSPGQVNRQESFLLVQFLRAACQAAYRSVFEHA